MTEIKKCTSDISSEISISYSTLEIAIEIESKFIIIRH